MFGLGVVGLGAFGEFSLAAYSDLKSCRLVGLSDTDKDLSHLSQDSAKIYSSLAKMLKDPHIDIVIINTPNFLHYEQVKACLNAHKHVFCEKPLTLKLEQARELFDLAKTLNLILGVDHPLVFSKIYSRLKNMLSQRLFGDVLRVEVHNLAREGEITTSWFWDQDQSGGWFLNSDYHFIYLSNYLLGKGGVVSSSERVVKGKTTATRLKLSYGNASVVIDHELLAPEPSCKVIIQTTKAQIVIKGWAPLKYEITQKGEIIDSFSIPGDSEEEYLALIKACFEDFLGKTSSTGFALSDQDILTTLALSLQAQKKARITLDNALAEQ